jgi:iron complex outermembrane receptor protein
MHLRRMLRVVAVLVTAVLWNAPAWAQSQAKITGTVRDATGAALPGATVTATHLPSSTSRTATTAADGSYSIAVSPGAWTVTVTLSGFRRASRGVEVPNTGATADFSLEAQLSEEVTVTAMKRETTVIDTPFSIAAPTEELLKMRGVEDIEGVAANVGGFTVQNLGPGQSQVALRGVSAGQIVRDQPGVKEQVGIYLDESVISLSLFTPDVDLFDVSRVEVLRGPQGTLFGSGSLSGTVRYITNQPELGVTAGVAELGANFVGGGGPGANAKIAYNLPVGNKAAARFVGYYNHIGGYIDAVQPDLSTEDNVNDGFRTGFRASVKFVPNAKLTVTPRVLYQKVDMNGWNRHDAFNILGNPFTTTRPAVTLDDREQFTQLQEEFSDNFFLADLNLTYGLGDMTLTSITSYGYRDVLVKRDATALTASITGGSIGLAENVYVLDAPLFDATTANVWTQEVRLSGRARDRFHWVGGLFYSHQNRDYGQSLPVNGFEELTGIPTTGLRAPTDVLFFSDLDYSLNQFGLFGEGTYEFTPEFSLTGGLRFYHFGEDKEQIFDGIFAHDNTGTAVVSQPGDTDANGVAPRIIASYQLAPSTYLNAQVSKGFRLGGINDPLNVPLCSAQDLVTFGGRDTWDDEKVWNYEAGVKTRVLNGLGALNVSGFYMDISDLQATVTAGSCSSRVVFNVPKARSTGVEIEFEAAPTQNFDFALSTVINDSQIGSTLTSTDASGNVTVVSGIEEGRRLPTVPQFQFVAAATYQWEVRPGYLSYVTGSYQHIGSRFTQVGDEDLGTLNLLSFGGNTIGAPLTSSAFVYDPELPAYDLLNLRAGLRRNQWDIAVYLNNVTDEKALLSFDQERGTRARIGYVTNQPRTFGILTRFNF